MMITPAAVYSGAKNLKNVIFYVKSPHNFCNKKCVAISRKKNHEKKNPFLKRHLLIQDILQVHLFYVQVDSSTK